MSAESIFNDLRGKLNIFGYTQPLPLAALPLVENLFDDLVKTTESLRDSKQQICALLEEKECWELGVEPYKCENSRLLAQCNQLHSEMITQHDEYEAKICGLCQHIRSLESDKKDLQEHSEQLQAQLRALVANSLGTKNAKDKNNIGNMNKKPFISTVRSGDFIRNPCDNIPIKCTKCNVGYIKQQPGMGTSAELTKDLDRLENCVKDLNDQVSYYKKKVECRDREIQRLNKLLEGGRPLAALARDCCYKDVDALSQDIEILQKEKSESLCKIREYQEKMHEAMQRAMDLEKKNQKLQKDYEELKAAALSVESQANIEVAEREKEIEELKACLQKLKSKFCDKTDSPSDEKRKINERLNELTQKESEMKYVIEKLERKNQKLKMKLCSCMKELEDKRSKDDQFIDEERIRLRSERDFFQKEYLRMIGKVGSEKEVEFLQSQVKSKDEELRTLRNELSRQQAQLNCRSDRSTPCDQAAQINANWDGANCVQAAVARAERERDLAKLELERISNERNTLREKLQSASKLQMECSQKYQATINELCNRVSVLECNNRELDSARIPSQTQIVVLKEEVDCLRQKLKNLQEENNKLKTGQNQLKSLHDQTERALSEYQSKLAIAESKLEAAGTQLGRYDSTRDALRNEIESLKNEIASLKCTYLQIENEKDKIVTELDEKTEKVNQLEEDLKNTRDKRNELEGQVRDLERKLGYLSSHTVKRESELKDTTSETKSLRQQIAALKSSRDQAIEENGRLSNDLAESRAEIATLKRRLKDSEVEIERLKQQLKQYVQEVKKAEDLLLHKEKEREEMLDHYRSLSHDAVLLEGNNHSLEAEAAEYKRQLCEAEDEIAAMKDELSSRKDLIEKLEAQIEALRAQNTFLENQLEEAYDEQKLLKVDLSARKDLCDKLDNERDKLNAEVSELNKIRKTLERDNEKLRLESEWNMTGTKATADTFEELLHKTRRELEEQIKVDSKLSQELLRLKQRNEDLLCELNEEREKRRRHETLAHEYGVQNQELRHNITDDRFRQARSRAESPKFTTM